MPESTISMGTAVRGSLGQAAHDAFGTVVDEVEDDPALRAAWQGLQHALHGTLHVVVAHEDLPVDVLDAGNGIVRIAAAAQAHHVHAHVAQGLACGLHEGGHVLAHQAGPGDETVGTDVDELLHGHIAFQDGPIIDGHMARQVHTVGDHHVVAHDAVVCHVHIGHQQGVAPHGGLHAVGGAPVDRHAFAHRGAIAH